MRIMIYPARCLPFPHDILSKKALSGTETAIIRVSEALQIMGHEVFVVSDKYPAPEHRPAYITQNQALLMPPVDVLLIVRGWRTSFLGVRRKLTFFWTGDADWSFHNMGIGDNRCSDLYDGYLFVSSWQADRYTENIGVPLPKVYLLENGVNPLDFCGSETRHPKRLIYTSMPDRGLVYLPILFQALQEKHPDLELHIFCGSASCSRDEKGNNEEYDKQNTDYAELLEICRVLPGVFVRSPVTQRVLARELMRATVWAYPTNFEETSCIAAMEAQAAGCPIVTSKLGALPETVGSAGILLEGTAGTPEYHQKFVQAVDEVLSNPTISQELSSKGRKRAQGFSWEIRAEAFIHTIQEIMRKKENDEAI